MKKATEDKARVFAYEIEIVALDGRTLLDTRLIVGDYEKTERFTFLMQKLDRAHGRHGYTILPEIVDGRGRWFGRVIADRVAEEFGTTLAS